MDNLLLENEFDDEENIETLKCFSTCKRRLKFRNKNVSSNLIHFGGCECRNGDH